MYEVVIVKKNNKMNIVKTIEQYNIQYIYFCEPIKNTIMNEGMFIRILYSTPNFVLNGISLFLPFNDVHVEKYYNKLKCSFNMNNHKDLIEKIKNIEEGILNKINTKNKIVNYKIYDQLKNGSIKIFIENTEKYFQNQQTNHLFMLKISGVWETDKNIGVTYKFMKISKIL